MNQGGNLVKGPQPFTYSTQVPPSRLDLHSLGDAGIALALVYARFTNIHIDHGRATPEPLSFIPAAPPCTVRSSKEVEAAVFGMQHTAIQPLNTGEGPNTRKVPSRLLLTRPLARTARFQKRRGISQGTADDARHGRSDAALVGGRARHRVLPPLNGPPGREAYHRARPRRPTHPLLQPAAVQMRGGVRVLLRWIRRRC